MGVVNRILGRLFEGLLGPFSGWPPLVSLALVSLVVAIGALLVYRFTSNQAGIARAKRRMQAGLYEIRLLNDDPRFVLRACADILRHDLSYLRFSLVPLVVMLVPLVLTIAHLQVFYGQQPLAPGATFLLRAKLAERTFARPDLSLEVPVGLRVETPGVWVRSLTEVVWRVRAEQPGEYVMQVRASGATLAKEVRVGGGLQRLSPVRERPRFWGQVLYPSEPPLPPTSPVASLTLDYPNRAVGLGSLRAHWLVAFFVLVLGFALLLRRRLKVTF
jgi:hypothetical protein